MQSYSSDAPLNDPSFDRFNRYPFSQRVAEVISRREDSSSIVIGINGAWGEGKTTILNFMEYELKQEEHVVCLKFNPWRFDDEDQMLINFFTDLAATLDKSLETRSEKLGDFIEKFAKPVATIAGKEALVTNLKLFLPRADIEELKERIELRLKEAKKRVVILMDDIDRLDKKDIHALFRLVKLTADLKYTAYVLAFDKEVVSVALQERYGSIQEEGRSFLDKIIQVPLDTPLISKADLRNFYFTELKEVLDFAKIELNDEDSRVFSDYFTRTLEVHLKTPRQVKLYVNLLRFSLPILDGEVNVVDLMLVEGIKVLLPNLYTDIKNNKDIFLKMERNYCGIKLDDKEKEQRKKRILKTLEGFPYEEKEGIKSLLFYLFPKIEGLFKNQEIGSDADNKWDNEKRICSPRYFERYFTYSVNTDDVSDTFLENLIEQSKTHSVEYIVPIIKKVLTNENAESFITKLRVKHSVLNQEQSKVLASSIIKIGHKFPNPIQFLRWLNSFGQAAMFVYDCVENIIDKEEKVQLAKSAIKDARDLAFAFECFRHYRLESDEEPNVQGFTDREMAVLSKCMATRISSDLSDFRQDNIDKLETLPQILKVWKECGETDDALKALNKKIESEPDFVFDLLDKYTARTFSGYSVKRAEFDKGCYDAVSGIINVDVIEAAIKRKFSDLPPEEKYPNYLESPREEELARQFLWLHRNRKKKEL